MHGTALEMRNHMRAGMESKVGQLWLKHQRYCMVGEHETLEEAQDKGETATFLEELLTSQLEPVWVTRDMCGLLAASARLDAGLDMSHGLLREDLLVEDGFALLERPIDRWAESQMGAADPGFVDLSDEDSYAGRYQVWGQVDQISAIAWGTYNDGEFLLIDFLEDWDRYERFAEHASRMRRVLPLRTGWPQSLHWGESPMDNVMLRIYTALILIMQQKLAVVTQEDPDRAVRRREARLAHDVDPVTVIRLRRREYEATAKGQDGSVDWDHRWMVRPHWRWQWYPALKRHKQVLVPGHVKGPVDKELIVKERAFEVIR